ncbi:MAG: FkbM family methyltransferase [Anaerolineales bacterium]
MDALRHAVLKMAAWTARRLPSKVRTALYRLGPATGLIRGALNQAAPQGRTKVEIAAGLLQGSHFELDLQEEKDLWLGNYETALQAWLPSWIQSGMVVYDVGANIGYLTVAFAQLVGPKGSVYAFEPLPENQIRLEQAVADNNLEERIRVIEAAVGAGGQRARFLVHASGGMGKLAGSYGRDTAYASQIEVEVCTLDDYVLGGQAPAPDWVKVDVEGGEGAVLQGANQLLKEVRPSWLVEIHGPEAGKQTLQLLQEADYRLWTIGQQLRSVLDPDHLDWKAYLLALPEERAENILHG